MSDKIRLKNYTNELGSPAILVTLKVRQSISFYDKFLVPHGSSMQEILDMFYYFLKTRARHINVEKIDKNEYMISYHCEKRGYKRTKIKVSKTNHLIYKNIHYSTALINSNIRLSEYRKSLYKKFEKYIFC